MDFLEKIEEFVKISVKRYGHLLGQGVYYKQIARRRPSMKTIKAKILVLSAFALLLLSLVGCSSLFSSEENKFIIFAMIIPAAVASENATIPRIKINKV